MKRARIAKLTPSRPAALAGLVLLVAAATPPAGGQPPAIPNLEGRILTVRGPIDPALTGTTLMHEHIFIEFRAPARADDPDEQERGAPNTPQGAAPGGSSLTRYDDMLTEVMASKDAGGGTSVDLTNAGLTRRPAWLRRVSEASGLHVVMGSGWYMRTFHPADMDTRTADELTAIIVRDITVGA